MKHLFMTAASTALFAFAAHAGDASKPLTDHSFNAAEDFYASDLIGMRVYAADPEDSTATSVDWDDIGEIEDLIVTKDGEIASVIVGVGGFLGLGERDVAMDMKQIEIRTEEGDDDRFLVVNIDRETLENVPPFETRSDARQARDVADWNKISAFDAERPRLERPEIKREGWMSAADERLTAEKLDGATVYGPGDEAVGEIDRVILARNEGEQRAVIDVGGWLGLGEKPVLVSFDELTFMREEDGEDLRVYIDSTKAALENQPEFEG